MVKAKIAVKPKVKSKSAQCVSSCRKNRTSGYAGKKMDAVPRCDCGEIIDDDVKAVQCERCVENETLKCANCLER